MKVTPKSCSFCNKQAVSYSSPDHYCQEHRDQYWKWADNLPMKAELKRVLDNDKPY